MQFTSVIFIGFVLISLLCLQFIPGKYLKYTLIILNLGFYLSNGLLGGVFLFAVALISFLTAKKKIKVVPCLAIVAIVLLYIYHCTGAYYPIGFSFYGLMAIGYIMDVSNGKYEPVDNFADLFAALSFFPIIQSGPIEKLSDLVSQIKSNAHRNSKPVIASGNIMLILWGFIEKIALANIAGIFVNEIFNNYGEHSWLSYILATVVYAFQLYADFDGYSNIAFGIAGCMGIRVTVNFDTPYLATGVREFWKRWHISLSTWLKNYVYIPLGGNRKGIARKYINLFVTFIVSGLWHGAGATFIIWGALHGLYQVVEDNIERIRTISVSRKASVGWIRKTCRVMLTFALVDFAWFFFRANSVPDAMGMLRGCFGGALSLTQLEQGGLSISNFIQECSLCGLSYIHVSYMLVTWMLLIVIDLTKRARISIFAKINNLATPIRFIIYYGMILWIILAGLSTMNMDMSGFIYGQF